MDRKVLKFDLSSNNIQVKNLLNQQFLNIYIEAISDIKPNRNNCWFTTQSIYDAKNSVYNKPVLCHYNARTDTMGGHDSNGFRFDVETGNVYEDFNGEDCEIPVGIIRESDVVEIKPKDDLNWLCFSCALWVQYNYKLVKKLLKSGNCRVSVEVEVLESYDDEDGIEVITKFELLAVTLIGVTEAIPGANATVLDLQKTELYEKFSNRLRFAYKKLEEETGENKENTPKDTPVENEHKDEIGFNKQNDFVENNSININLEKGEVQSMTYQEKRQVLESALAEALKNLDDDLWYWVEDLDDEYVYYCIGEDKFRSKYELVEGGANIDIENREYVVRSWRVYTEEEMKNKNFDVSDPNGAQAGATQVHHVDDESGTNVTQVTTNVNKNAEEPKEEPGKEGNKENSSAENKVEQSAENDTSKENESKENESKGCNSEGDKDEPKDENKENSSKECNTEEEPKDENKEKNSKECNSENEPKEEPNKENNAEENKECKMTEGNKEECSTVQNPPIISKDTYEALVNKFNSLEKDYNELKTKFTDNMNNELLKFADTFIKAETDLTEESVKAVYAVVEKEIKASKFSSCEEVEKFATTEIATVLYKQNKENKKNQKNEFSYNINKDTISCNIMGSASDVDELKKANEALSKL